MTRSGERTVPVALGVCRVIHSSTLFSLVIIFNVPVPMAQSGAVSLVSYVVMDKGRDKGR